MNEQPPGARGAGRRPGEVQRSRPYAIRMDVDPGLRALALIARFHHVSVDPAGLAHELGLRGKPATSEDIVRAAKISGLKAQILRGQRRERLEGAPRPAIIKDNNGRYLILNYLDGKDTIRDPLEFHPRNTTIEEICQDWSGELILVALGAGAEVTRGEFGWRWFGACFFRYKKSIAHVLLASMFLQLFALATPLFFQVVVDKVLVHKSLATLQVIVLGMVLLNFFGVALQYLRAYALYHTASRIDVELGSKIFERLFKLPLSYFETRATGQTVARVREIETIRAFLTGQGLTSIIDVIFATVFLAFLFLYSATLAWIVIASIPVYILIAALVRPLFRNKIKEKFNAGARSQQFLVESIVCAPGLKASAVEPLMQQQWEERLAHYVRISLQAVMLGNLGQSLIQFATQLTTILILFFGAQAVIAGDMTVGELIAFNMISRQVVAPILRLSQLWQDVQQIQISVERLADIYNSQPEGHVDTVGRFPEAKVQGAISLKEIVFRYQPGTPEVLKDVSIEIPAGQVLGIVGASGSGKSTLTKLIQRLYIPERGKISIDGVDIAHVHPAWFRRQIGVVLQETQLLNRTIHENIALTVPGMSRDRVMAVAQLAGAHEFIRELPQGYETRVEEWGANLSGGQRQRIAIARALARNPRILIFDEATSALDYESEMIIHANMRRIVQDRTVIIVAHRLAAIRICDRVISMDKGRIAEDGTREQLLAANGVFARLWALQTADANPLPLAAKLG